MAGDAAFAALWSGAYGDALAAGLPLFGAGVSRAAPMTAAPHVVSASAFLADFGTSAHRQRLLGAWREGMAEAVSMGFAPCLAIVGGSFLDRRIDAPRDLDCAIFYDRTGVLGSEATALRALQHRLIGVGVDVRFMPGDQSRLFMAKAVGFFMLLYTQQRRADGRVCAPLLVVLDDGDAGVAG